MDIQKEKDLYLAELLEREVITQDEFRDLVFKPEINAFDSNYLSSRFIDKINFGWSVWQAKAQAVPEWISVEDKLPEIGVYVMVFLEKQGHNPTAYNFCQYTKFGFHLSNVTHWAPLPEPPETQEPAND